MIKSVGVGPMGSALAVIVLVFVIILMFRIGSSVSLSQEVAA